MHTAARSRFTTLTARIAMAVFGSVIALLGLSGIFFDQKVGGKIFAGVMLVVGIAVAVRGAMSSVVVVSADGVRLQAIQRTRRLGWDRVRAAHMEIANVGMTGYHREVLVVDMVDGSSLMFKDLNSRQARPGQTTVVAAAVDAINDAARAH